LELAKVFVTARGDVGRVAGDLRAGTPAVASAARGLQSTINRILATVGIGLSIGAIISQMRQAVPLAERQIDAEARMAAVVRGTGEAAGFTANQLKQMAAEMQKVTTVGDEEFMEMAAIMLTFKSITGDVFKTATETVLDMAAVMGTQARSAAMQLGRALEDPIRGVSALRRTGVSFSEQQKSHIKQLVESNKLSEAQAFVLSVVRGQLGEVAKAMAKTDAGKLKQARNILGDIREELGKKLIPVWTQFIELMGSLLKTFIPIVIRGAQLVGVLAKLFTRYTLVKGIVIGLIAALTAYTAVTKAAAIASTIATAVAGGPAGWVKIAAGIAVATAATAAVVMAFESAEVQAASTADKVDDLKSNVQTLARQTAGVNRLTSAFKSLQEVVSNMPQPMGNLLELFFKLGEKAPAEIARLEKEIADIEERKQRGEPGTYGEDLWRRKIELGIAKENLARYKNLTEAFGGAGRAASFMADVMSKLNERLTDGAGDINEYAANLQELVERGWIDAADKAWLLDKAMEEIGDPRAAGREKIQSMIEEAYRLRNGLSEAAIALREFSQTPGVTQSMIHQFEQLQEQIGLLQSNKEWRDAAKGFEEQYKSPMKKKMEELLELQNAYQYGQGELSTEAFERARKAIEGRYKEPALTGAGAIGFAEFGKRMQDAILKQDDPQRQIATNTRTTAVGVMRMNDELREFTEGLRAGNNEAVYARN